MRNNTFPARHDNDNEITCIEYKKHMLFLFKTITYLKHRASN